jgi:hypothetical protein
MDIHPFQVFFDKHFPTDKKVGSGLKGMRLLLNSFDYTPNMVVTFSLGYTVTDEQLQWLTNNSNGRFLYDSIKRIYFENGMAALMFYLKFYDEIV